MLDLIVEATWTGIFHGKVLNYEFKFFNRLRSIQNFCSISSYRVLIGCIFLRVYLLYLNFKTLAPVFLKILLVIC